MSSSNGRCLSHTAIVHFHDCGRKRVILRNWKKTREQKDAESWISIYSSYVIVIWNSHTTRQHRLIADSLSHGHFLEKLWKRHWVSRRSLLCITGEVHGPWSEEIPKPTTVGMYKTLVNNGINYQPQPVNPGFMNHQQYQLIFMISDENLLYHLSR